jgi:hypothetical protein
VRIDRTHRGWFIGSLGLLIIAVLVYVPYRHSSPQGPSGGSLIGLTYGSIGSAFMLFAGLLGARKKFPILRVGRAQTWMRGHLWLGTISFPLILFHAGFRFGFGLTNILMWIFLVVFLSGIFGAVLQHFMPRLTTERIPMETIYEQIGRVRTQLVDEADGLVKEASAALTGSLAQASIEQRAAAAGAGTIGGLTVASGLQVNEEADIELRQFFQQEMRPFLEQAGSGRLPVADRGSSNAKFQRLRLLLPPSLHLIVEDLENICEEKRELDTQARYHRVLHGWLLVHIPLSYALLLLGAVHAVEALRY